MTDSKKAKSEIKQQPVKTIRNGAIAASIWRRQTATGFEYLDFSLSRSWKLKSGDKEGYSQSFFEGNEEALQHVITQTCDFIRAQQREQPVESSRRDPAIRATKRLWMNSVRRAG